MLWKWQKRVATSAQPTALTRDRKKRSIDCVNSIKAKATGENNGTSYFNQEALHLLLQIFPLGNRQQDGTR